MEEIRVVLIADHPIVRARIRDVLDRAPDVAILGEAGDEATALRLVKDKVPDVAVLDMEMLNLAGVETARQLQATPSPTRILALCAVDDEEYAFDLLAMGVAGYVMKDEALETIVEAVRGVAHGISGWMSRHAAARMMVWARKKIQEQVPKGEWLTERESELLQLLAQVERTASRRYARLQ